jgi:hypothetical protein
VIGEDVNLAARIEAFQPARTGVCVKGESAWLRIREALGIPERLGA